MTLAETVATLAGGYIPVDRPNPRTARGFVRAIKAGQHLQWRGVGRHNAALIGALAKHIERLQKHKNKKAKKV
jgi:hypothetical protein